MVVPQWKLAEERARQRQERELRRLHANFAALYELCLVRGVKVPPELRAAAARSRREVRSQ